MSNTNDYEPGDALWEYLGVDRRAPLKLVEFARAMRNLQRQHEDDSSTTVYAFRALNQIGWAELDFRERELKNSTLIGVPWWVVQAIMIAWCKYENAPEGATFGECAGLEGGRQGAHRTTAKINTLSRNKLLAADVESIRKSRGLTIAEACAEIARRSGRSEDTIEKIYKQHYKEPRRHLGGA